jgi:predicted CXXCH cytochrome family protein
LRFKRTGFEYTCNECHKDFKTSREYYKPAGEHQNIVLNHGLNVNCLNCHHYEDRDYYSAYGHLKILPEESYRVCMKCHGPIYRDWEAEIHGRVNGYWNTELGPQHKLDCTQCHDPHSPVFKSLIPMPPPSDSRLKTLIQDNPHG